MPMYNLIEYSDNYSDTSGSLWHIKRDKIGRDDDLTVDAQCIPNNSPSFKYKSSFITNRNGVKIAVPLKYLSNFWRSLEIPLVNCKVELLSTWYESCILSSAGTAATFAITEAKLVKTSCYFKNWRQCRNSFRKYFLPRFKIKNYNIEIDWRNSYDQSINDLTKQYDAMRKISRGQGDD